MSTFLRQAEDILETASQGETDQNVVIVIDRLGGMRMMDPTGWTLPALSAEFGATAIYHVDRRGNAIRVEGLSGSERCLLQRKNSAAKSWCLGMPGMPAYAAPKAQPMMLQTSALMLA